MYCQKCGKYNSEDKEVCMYCGHHMKDLDNSAGKQKKSFYEGSAWQNKQSYQRRDGEDKTGVGIVLSIFLGLIGLLIGLGLYPSYSYSRETFIKGWVKGFIIEIVIAVILSIAVICAGTCMLQRYY